MTYCKQILLILSIPFIFCSCILLSGCSKIYWDEKWIYESFVSFPKEQQVRISSSPPAFLWIDGKYAGKTPLDINLSYILNQFSLKKQQFKESFGGKKEILDQEQRTENITQPGKHTFHFKSSGFHDLFLPMEISVKTDSVNVSLQKKAGIEHIISCSFNISAEKKDLDDIGKIISDHALTSEIVKTPAVLVSEPDRYRQSFNLKIQDSNSLQSLIDTLFSQAKKRHIILNVSDFNIEASLSTNPEREFRAVWISYIDRPGTQKNLNLQKQSLIKMLDEFKGLNFNAVIFHVRVEGDAVYKSDIEPWSRQFTGIQGRYPGYDPLEFIIREAHKRGMELHAWINPYRVNISKRCSNSSASANNHISRIRPEWILNIKMLDSNGCYKMLNPGIPEVTDYITDITQDIVLRYNIDGIHFDDMFYPYPFKEFKGISWEDRDTYNKYKKDNIPIKDWRRRNVNRLVRQVNAGIKKSKKHVRFGISPFGIWQNEIPKGIKGMSAYDVIYSDAMAWLEDKSIDYLAPQLYWKIGDNPDYKKLLSWWGQKVKQAQRHIYPGQIIYYVKPEKKTGRKTKLISKPETSEDILDQINLNRENRDINVLGNTFYRAVNIQNHILGSDDFKNMLAKGVYATPALPPSMPWIQDFMADAPTNVSMSIENDSILLKWDKTDSEQNYWKYAVYTANNQDIIDGKSFADAVHMIAVTGENSIKISKHIPIQKGDYLFVKSVSYNNIESKLSDPVRVE